ncbi:MAG: ribosomal RNA small subunit methyltransferase A [Candidatus Lokiarchaeota archaeon]|nr:ribosomal RNA small subunit methyltransferase A [Candidatus Lokiarchaeota archaeon]
MTLKIQRILHENKIKLSRLKSQHFMINKEILKEMVGAGSDLGGEEIVEIGAGIGNLTKFIAKTAKKVIAVEKEEKFIPLLKNELEEFNNIEIINEDILNLDKAIFLDRKIISNPPYHISSPLLMKILDSDYKLCVMTLQLEFVERMVGESGGSDYSRLTLRVNYNSKVEILRKISKNNFYPSPKVDSALVRIQPKTPIVEVDDKRFYFSLINQLFNHKNQLVRKVIKNRLKKTELPSSTIEHFRDKLPYKKLRVRELDHYKIKEIFNYINTEYNELKRFWNI